MWREYTRETPARPMLTLFAASLALGLTTGLAYFVIHTRPASSRFLGRLTADPGRRSAVSESDLAIPRGWPIRWDLPAGFRYVGPADSWQDVYDSQGTAGSIAYCRVDPHNGLPLVDTGLHVVVLKVRFSYFEPSTRLTALYREITGLSPDDAAPIALGRFNGLMGVGTVHPTGRRYVAVALDDSGLVIHLEMEMAAEDSSDRADFEAICESITVQDWFVRVRATDEH